MPISSDYPPASWRTWGKPSPPHKRRWVWTLALWGLAATYLHGAALPKQAAAEPPSQSVKRSYQYSMTGRVRLLLFWVSRENVGRGLIGVDRSDNPADDSSSEKMEVLIGTLPTRVPGGINRWGYGNETALWRGAEGAGNRNLESSQFLGFMRHSAEESLSQVASTQQQEQGRQQYWYDGIASTVKPQESHTEVYYFSMPQEVSLENMEQVRQAFQTRLGRDHPDKVKQLANHPVQYGAPQGFLTCLRGTMAAASQAYHQKGEKLWEKEHPQTVYVYNAKLYKLESLSQKVHKPFPFSLPAQSSLQPAISALAEVAEVEYQITNLASGERTHFTLWFPLSGPLANIPIQIRYGPRWWLQVQLQLTGIKEGQP